jgi:hypothetical protein
MKVLFSRVLRVEAIGKLDKYSAAQLAADGSVNLDGTAEMDIRAGELVGPSRRRETLNS